MTKENSHHLIFVHGWSFCQDIWPEVLTYIGPHNKNLHFIDPVKDHHNVASFSFLNQAIVIGHSLGVLWLLEQSAHFNYKALISIAGFDCFYKHKDKRNIEVMQHMLDRNPMKQINDFRHFAGTPSKYTGKMPSLQTMKTGLSWLLSKDCSSQRQALTCPIHILASEDDTIVPKDMTEKCWPSQSIHWIKNGNHILPLTQPKWVAHHITSILENT